LYKKKKRPITDPTLSPLLQWVCGARDSNFGLTIFIVAEIRFEWEGQIFPILKHKPIQLAILFLFLSLLLDAFLLLRIFFNYVDEDEEDGGRR